MFTVALMLEGCEVVVVGGGGWESGVTTSFGQNCAPKNSMSQ